MGKVLRCSDVIPGCDAIFWGETEQEVLHQTAEHARAVHEMEEIDEETAKKVKEAIRDE